VKSFPQIRRALQDDVAAMDSLLEQLDDLHVRKLPWLLQKAEGPRSLVDLESYINSTDKAAFVASDPGVIGVILAYVRALPTVPVLRPGRVAEIEALFVHPAHRRQGLGAALVRAAVDWSRHVGASRVELGFYEFNEAAHAFWERLGFDSLSRRVFRPV
jgi:GNAT superfamily N-acetyltransferase